MLRILREKLSAALAVAQISESRGAKAWRVVVYACLQCACGYMFILPSFPLFVVSPFYA